MKRSIKTDEDLYKDLLEDMFSVIVVLLQRDKPIVKQIDPARPCKEFFSYYTHFEAATMLLYKNTCQ
jgi:hypothetical protein